MPSGEEAWEVGALGAGFLGCGAAAFGAGALGGGGAGLGAIDVEEGASGALVIGWMVVCAMVGGVVLVVSGSAG